MEPWGISTPRLHIRSMLTDAPTAGSAANEELFPFLSNAQAPWVVPLRAQGRYESGLDIAVLGASTLDVGATIGSQPGSTPIW